MVKNIILQHFDGELRELDKLSMANIQEYAKLVDADYKLVTGKPFSKYLTSPCQKIHMLAEEFDDYDDVLMIDIDMFTPRGMTVNVFKEAGIGLYGDTQQRLHRELVARYPMLASSIHPYWGGAIYKLSKDMRVQLRSALTYNTAWVSNYNKHKWYEDKETSWMSNYNKHMWYEDEGIIHTLAVKSNFRPQEPYLNVKWCQCSFLPNPEKAGFIHIRTKVAPEGPKRAKIENYQALVDQGIL
tara:strand:- start:8338 stop:9063 length:726 start_codon:yes stop_codon:yes gene_type:complete